MSVASIAERIAHIESLVARVEGRAVPAQAPSGDGAFAAALQSAQASTAVAPVAGDETAYDAAIQAAAARHGIDPALLKGLIRQESNFNPAARSSAGALGLTQLMPATAAELGVTDPTDPLQAIEGGALYLRRQLDRFGGDVRLALAAYNAGPGAVQRFGGVPPYGETQAYVQRVLGYAEQYRASFQPLTTPTPAPASATVGGRTGGSLGYSTI